MKRLSNIIYVAALSLFLFSCNDFLDKLPDDRAQLDSKEAIGKILVNAYPRGEYVAFCEAMSDNVSDKGIDAYYQVPNNRSSYMFDEFYTNSFQGSPDYYWSSCYEAISHANQALEAIEKVGGEELNSYKGEALLARAYSHFMLVNVFAKHYNVETAKSDLGVPYVDEVEKVLIKEYTRNTVDEVYQKVERDIEEGIKLLDDTRYIVPKYHFTTAAANAFASRFYLWRGASKEDYIKAAEYASKVLPVDAASVLRDWNGYYTSASYPNKKAQYTRASEKPNLLLSESISELHYIAYLRYSLTMDKLREVYWSTWVNGLRFAHGLHGDEKSVHIPKWNLYKIKDNPSSTSYYPSVMVPLLTTDEVIYNRIEANIYLEKYSDALADINTILSTRVSNFTNDDKISIEDIHNFFEGGSQAESLILCTLDLKRKDFMFEGLRWFDIKRYKLPVVHTSYDGEVYELKADDPRKAVQIPESAILNGLKKNVY